MNDIDKLIKWHESVIKQYPVSIQNEFRDARLKLIAYWKRKSQETPFKPYIRRV